MGGQTLETEALDYKTIMERIKWIKEDQNLSLRSFADTLGVSKSVTDNLIYQRVERVNDLYINLICDKLNVNQEWLLYGQGDPYKEYKPVDPNLTKWISEIAEDSTSPIWDLMTKLNKLEDEDLKLASQVVNRLLKTTKK